MGPSIASTWPLTSCTTSIVWLQVWPPSPVPVSSQGTLSVLSFISSLGRYLCTRMYLEPSLTFVSFQAASPNLPPFSGCLASSYRHVFPRMLASVYDYDRWKPYSMSKWLQTPPITTILTIEKFLTVFLTVDVQREGRTFLSMPSQPVPSPSGLVHAPVVVRSTSAVRQEVPLSLSTSHSEVGLLRRGPLGIFSGRQLAFVPFSILKLLSSAILRTRQPSSFITNFVERTQLLLHPLCPICPDGVCMIPRRLKYFTLSLSSHGSHEVSKNGKKQR